MSRTHKIHFVHFEQNDEICACYDNMKYNLVVKRYCGIIMACDSTKIYFPTKSLC